MIAIAFALLLAGEELPPPADTVDLAAEAPAAAGVAKDEEEICRRITVPSPRSAGGHKTQKVCKTREEWKDFAMRRS